MSYRISLTPVCLGNSVVSCLEAGTITATMSGRDATNAFYRVIGPAFLRIPILSVTIPIRTSRNHTGSTFLCRSLQGTGRLSGSITGWNSTGQAWGCLEGNSRGPLKLAYWKDPVSLVFAAAAHLS